MAAAPPSRWRDPDSVALPAAFLPELHPVVRAIVWRRGYRSDAAAQTFLQPRTFRLPESAGYPQLTAAAARLDHALRDHERICVWGDYDADGQTATAVLVGVLRRLGANVTYYVPNRLSVARGLNAPTLERLAAEGCRLVVTCDCATNDAALVAYATKLGLAVVISDHHQQIGPLPEAVAVVNSSHLAADDPLHGLPGAAVAFLVARALFARLGRAGEADAELDLVALGIVADVAPHTPACRALLARGLPRLWREPRPGVRALLDLMGLHPTPLDTVAISYKVAPILNAAGRLAEASEGVELLLASDDAGARVLALRLQSLNQERQRLLSLLELEIADQLAAIDPAAPALVLDGLGWHPGLLGLLANRLARQHGRPAVIIARSEDGGPARGSVRGFGATSILHALSEQAHRLEAFGGHPGAAGLTIAPERIDEFRAGFLASLAAQRPAVGPPALVIDALVRWPALDIADLGGGSLFAQLMCLAPFAEGNPEPILATRNLRVVSRRPFGENGKHARLTLADATGIRHEVTWWQQDPQWQPDGPIDVAYTLTRHEWQGQSSIRLTLQGARPHLEDAGAPTAAVS